MDIKERDLLEVPILFVNENGNTYAHALSYTNNGLPYYMCSAEKYQNQKNQFDEILFLPIENKNFMENQKKSLIGYRYTLGVMNHNMLSLVENPMNGVSRFQFCYDIKRIRYSPDGKKAIKIEKVYDVLFPPQILNLQYSNMELEERYQQDILAIISMCCNWYIDKEI